MTTPQPATAGLLISCFGDATGGGLFSYVGGRLRALDRLASGALLVTDRGLRRVLPQRSPDGVTCRMLTYSENGASSSDVLARVLEPHDLHLHNDEILVVSSGTNEIVRVAQDGATQVFWRAEGEGDAWHLNCMAQVGPRLVVSAFGKFKSHGEWRDHKSDGSGVVYDPAAEEALVTGLCCPHHPRAIGDELVVCNSARHELVGFDLQTMRPSRRCALGGWTRGLSFDEGHIFVGISSPRDFPGEESLAHVAVLDRATWSVEDRIQVPCSEIYDVLLAPFSPAAPPAWWRRQMGET